VSESRVSRRALLAVAALPWSGWTTATTAAPPIEVSTALPGAALQGQGRLRYFGLHVYDAALWSPLRLAADSALETPLALELRYARALRGRSIAERSIDEMTRVGEFGAADGQRWLDAMKQVFPDVKPGDRITGIHRPGVGADFYFNGRPCGEVRDAQFAQLFFAMWLSPRTSQPALRSALLGAPQ
jgi:hypothetical protein